MYVLMDCNKLSQVSVAPNCRLSSSYCRMSGGIATKYVKYTVVSSRCLFFFKVSEVTVHSVFFS